MCGVVGLVQRYQAEARVDPAPLAEARDRLAGKCGAAELREIAVALEPFSLALVGWGGLRTLREERETRTLAERVAATLTEVADRADARLADTSRVASTQAAEEIAQAVVAARDVAWRLEQDALRNVGATEALAGPAVDALGTKGWFELWRLNLILNQLERQEVRGRDSGGLGIVVSFASAAWALAAADLTEAGLQGELESRRAVDAFRDGAVLWVETGERVVLAFAHKVAKEVGELGDNVRELREKLTADALLRTLMSREDAHVQAIAHTRWASNGIINGPNCHPVANDVEGDAPLARIVLGVLNGDVDNFPTLAKGWAIPEACTTDAKIIPLEVGRLLEGGAPLTAAFQEAVRSFAGSTAIAVLGSDDPGAAHLALRGSGQAIYVGLSDEGGALYASELYGVVELAPRFYKLDGERGEIVRLGDGASRVELSITDYDGASVALADSAFKAAPIATRDIDRGGFTHYFLKEISEAPRSVERTLRGKFVVEGTERAKFLMGDDVIPPAVREGLEAGTIRRVFVIGQGTAAVAGLAAADFMARRLRPAGIAVRGLPATDLSGFHLDVLGPEVLVVAVSQSGTTTDTNRTVDLARARGAHVIGIVNRRGSDLVDKSHGVLYTSDGRDVEMSVASTKAFYCQVVAGYLLALHLAHLAGAVTEAQLAGHLLRIADLPRCLRDVLTESRERIRLAAQLSLRRRHWTVVGSGPHFQAAREIRIKLSELCYKSVSVDTIEDKKHIDLSSEPMILVCAAGLSGAAAADAVKEVAIFKAHAAVPVVICDRGETRFKEYAAATIDVPATSPEVALLLNTIAGHLFSYETARAIDALAAPMRAAREVISVARESLESAAGDGQAARETLRHLRGALSAPAREAFRAVYAQEWDAALASREVALLVRALRLGLGQIPWRELSPGQAPPSARELLDELHAEIQQAIDALRRPIDAIKHQAKTVTVGISREASSVRPPAGVLVRGAVACGVSEDAIADQDAAALASIEPAVEACLGAVQYRLEDLSPLGAPTDATRIVALTKTGVSEHLESRADAGAPLSGTKRMIVRSPRVWVGHGRRDGRPFVLCPTYRDGLVSGLVLLHVGFREDLDLKGRVRGLRAVGRYEDLKCAITEWDVPWSDALLADLDVQTLLTASADKLAETIQAVQNA